VIGPNHGKGQSEEAVYAFAQEDLDDWQCSTNLVSTTNIHGGFFGVANITTRGPGVNDSLIAKDAERWPGACALLQVSPVRLHGSLFLTNDPRG